MYIPLVLPVLLIVFRRNCCLLFYIIDTEPEDDPCKHDGRIRSFVSLETLNEIRRRVQECRRVELCPQKFILNFNQTNLES